MSRYFTMYTDDSFSEEEEYSYGGMASSCSYRPLSPSFSPVEMFDQDFLGTGGNTSYTQHCRTTNFDFFQEYMEMKFQVKRLEGQLRSTQRDIELMDHRNTHLRSDVSILECALKDSSDRHYDQVKDMKSTIDYLREKLTSSEHLRHSQNLSNRYTISYLEEEKEMLLHKVNELNEKIDCLENELADRKGIARHISSDLNDISKQTTYVGNDVAYMQGEICNLNQLLDEKEHQNQILYREKMNLQERQRKIDCQSLQRYDKVPSWKFETDDNKQYANLHKTFDSLDNEHADLDYKQRHRENELETERIEKQYLSTKIKELERKNATLEQTIGKQENERTNTKHYSYEHDKKSQDMLLKSQTDTEKHLRSDNKRLEDNNRNLNDKIKKITKENEGLRRKIEDKSYDTQLKRFEHEVEKLNDEKRKLETEKIHLEKALQNEKKEKERMLLRPEQHNACLKGLHTTDTFSQRPSSKSDRGEDQHMEKMKAELMVKDDKINMHAEIEKTLYMKQSQDAKIIQDLRNDLMIERKRRSQEGSKQQTAITSRHRETEQRLKQVEADYMRIETDNRYIKNEKERLEMQIERMNKSLTVKSDKQLDSYKKDIEMLERSLADERTNRRKIDLENQRIHKERTELERALSTIKTKQNSEISDLQDQVYAKNEELVSLRKEMQQTENELSRYRKTDKDVKSLQDQLKSLRQHSDSGERTSKRELAESQKRVQELNRQIDNLHEEIRQLQETLRRHEESSKANDQMLQKELEKVSKENRELEKRLQALQSELDSCRDNLAHKSRSSKDSGLKRQLEEVTSELNDVKRELDDTKSRLSKLMGQKLTDNNPNIADLSDKNRPTKLAERYTELYDNQWTDAFEVIDRGDEEKTIGLLREILEDTMGYCRKMAGKQLDDMTGALMFGKQAGAGLPDVIKKQLKDSRKAMAESTAHTLFQEFRNGLKSKSDAVSRAALKVPKYLEEAFITCWLMSVQDPPVVLAASPRKGDRFNSDIYKAYTESGPKVNYVVWPVLYLNEGGAVLCKGVAQGFGKK